MTKNSSLCSLISSCIANARYEHLSSAAIAAAKNSLLDTLGVALAASGMEPAVHAVIGVAREQGGRPESGVLGFNDRLPAALAAMANGAMAHCLDFDDRTPWGAHAGSSLIPAVLALAERAGNVSGEHLITAIAVGQDLFVRLRSNVHRHQEWNLSSVMGVFSAAAGAAHILGLAPREAATALSVAGMTSSGTMQVVYGGADLRGMYAGFSASSAVTAALWAKKGMTGIEGVFEGKAGLFNVYFEGKYDRSRMVGGLGEDFLGSCMLYKPWPVVGIAHTYIHATIELMREHRLKPEDIGTINVFVGEYQQEMCLPADRRRRPETAVDAKFSLPFCVGIAAARGHIGVQDFAPTALRDPEVLSMTDRVVAVDDPSADWTGKSPVGRIEIITRGGQRLHRTGDQIPGSPEAPLDWECLARKFRECASVAKAPLTPSKAEAAIELVGQLEQLKNISPLFKTLQ